MAFCLTLYVTTFPTDELRSGGSLPKFSLKDNKAYEDTGIPGPFKGITKYLVTHHENYMPKSFLLDKEFKASHSS